MPQKSAKGSLGNLNLFLHQPTPPWKHWRKKGYRGASSSTFEECARIYVIKNERVLHIFISSLPFVCQRRRNGAVGTNNNSNDNRNVKKYIWKTGKAFYPPVGSGIDKAPLPKGSPKAVSRSYTLLLAVGCWVD